MNIPTTDYTIVSFDETTGMIIVQWEHSMTTCTVPIPIENGLYVVGEQLDSHIRYSFPMLHYIRLALITNDVTNTDAISSLIGQTFTDSTGTIDDAALFALEHMGITP